MADAMPSCAEWVGSVVRIVAPHDGHGRRSSSSDPRFPGIVWINFRDPDFFYEGLVHEAAHKHFDLANCAQALTTESPANFRSPLRSEPRTLRSILIAYHALVYIAAMYRDMRATALLPQNRIRTELADTLWCLRSARRSLHTGRRFLTEPGERFLAHTDLVLEHGT